MSRLPTGARSCLVVAALLGLALPVAAAGAQTSPPSRATMTNSIVAVVNGDVVSHADVVGRARLFALNAGIQVAPETLERLSAQVTRLLIDERLRMQEVQRRRIPVTDQDVADAIEELERRNGLPAGGLRAQLQQVGVQPRVLYDQIRTQIGWARLLRLQLGPQAQPSEQEVQEAIRNARARVGEPEYLVSEIFIPLDDPRNEAETRNFVEEVIGQLRRGTPFPVAATQFSQAQTALQGGDLGWTRKEELDPDVADVVSRMPVGAISNPIRVAGGYQIVSLRQKRESGRDFATMLALRQAIFRFGSRLDPDNPTPQQIALLERAQQMSQSARGCDGFDQAARAGGASVSPDTTPVRLETVDPPPLREELARLVPGRPSQPIITAEGIMVFMVCSKEQRNLAELTPEQARQQILRDRVENLSRQLQRDLRRRAQIDLRTEAAGR